MRNAGNRKKGRTSGNKWFDNRQEGYLKRGQREDIIWKKKLI